MHPNLLTSKREYEPKCKLVLKEQSRHLKNMHDEMRKYKRNSNIKTPAEKVEKVRKNKKLSFPF